MYGALSAAATRATAASKSTGSTKPLAGLPTDRFPLLAAHAAHMVAGDGDERFGFAVDVVIDGMLARVAGR
jgi:CubicO group peptidase (beta-lactamase class C family)